VPNQKKIDRVFDDAKLQRLKKCKKIILVMTQQKFFQSFYPTLTSKAQFSPSSSYFSKLPVL